jgi:FkbM family methyltransferase
VALVSADCPLCGTKPVNIYPIRGGLKMYVWDNDTHISRDIRDSGVWEPDVADAIEEYSRPDWTFLDLGAHIGFFSLFASTLFKEVIAVEPQKGAFEVLQQNIDLNDLDIEEHHCAVTDVDGEVQMVPAPENTGMAWIPRTEKGNTVTVPSKTLSTILGDRRPEFIKIDIEGCEYRALKDCPEILRGAQVLVSEWSSYQLERSSGCRAKNYYDLLTDAGFTVHNLEGRPVEFKHLPTGGYANILCLKEK